MQAIPSRSRKIDLPTSRTERIVRGIDHPTIFHLIGILANGLQIFMSILTEWFTHGIEVIQHSQMTLAEISRLRKPIHHLEIDVAMIIVSPRRVNHPIPNALKSGRKASRPGGINHEIAPEVKEDFFQSHIIRVLAICLQALKCRHVLKQTIRHSQ